MQHLSESTNCRHKFGITHQNGKHIRVGVLRKNPAARIRVGITHRGISRVHHGRHLHQNQQAHPFSIAASKVSRVHLYGSGLSCIAESASASESVSTSRIYQFAFTLSESLQLLQTFQNLNQHLLLESYLSESLKVHQNPGKRIYLVAYLASESLKYILSQFPLESISVHFPL